jgi:hypothetical protein
MMQSSVDAESLGWLSAYTQLYMMLLELQSEGADKDFAVGNTC